MFGFLESDFGFRFWLVEVRAVEEKVSFFDTVIATDMGLKVQALGVTTGKLVFRPVVSCLNGCQEGF